MLAIILATLGGAAQPINIPPTPWSIVEPLEFRVDNPTPVPASAAWNGTTHALSQSDMRLLVDRACAVWGRAVPNDIERCRATGWTAITTQASGFNFADNIDGIAFAPSPWPLIPNISGEASCDYIWPFASTAECDIWLSQTNGWSSYAVGGTGLFPITYINGTLLPGAPNGFSDIWGTILHEIGHTLGATHPTFCNGTTYNCPVMAQAISRVAYWPTIDDWRVLSQQGNGKKTKWVEWSIWDISSTGMLSNESGWNRFSGGGLSVVATNSPRIDCAPDAITNGDDSCIVSLPNADGTPNFATIDVSATALTIDEQVDVGTGWEGGMYVDVAMGDSSRYMGVGKRPVSASQPTQLIMYTGVVGSTTQPTSTIWAPFSTHVEPRVTYHEPSCSFVVSFVRKDAQPQVCSFSRTGSLNNCVTLPTATLWPVESICDAHLPGTENFCRTYVQPYGNAVPDRNGKFICFQVDVAPGSAPFTCTDTSGTRGQLSVSGSSTQGTYLSSLIVDGTSYGTGREAGQLNGGLYFMTEDRRVSSMADQTVRLRMDSDGLFNPPDTLSTTTSMSDTDAGNISNLTSWAWHEGRHRFVAVRLAGDAY